MLMPSISSHLLHVPSFILKFEDHVNSLFHILSGMILTQIYPQDFQGITVFLCILQKLHPVNKMLVYKNNKKFFDNILERDRAGYCPLYRGKFLQRREREKKTTRQAV